MDKEFVLTPEQQKLAEDNMNLVDIILHTRIKPNENIRGMEYDELYQFGCIALCRAAATYDGRVLFTTYANHVIYNALIDECRKAQVQYARLLSYDAAIAGDGDTHEMYLESPDEVDDDIKAEELVKILTNAKQKHTGAVLNGIEAIELQIKGYTGAEIARLYGVKNNNVTSWIAKARAVLRSEHPEYVK